jgi:hypothetical protein
MSLTLDYKHDEKVLFNDNIAVYTTKDRMDFFRVFITDTGACIGRYCVPGRLDIYTFDFIHATCGLGARIAFFSDLRDQTLIKAVMQLKRDLKKKQVKKLFADAKLKCPRSYLDPLLEALR